MRLAYHDSRQPPTNRKHSLLFASQYVDTAVAFKPLDLSASVMENINVNFKFSVLSFTSCPFSDHFSKCKKDTAKLSNVHPIVLRDLEYLPGTYGINF